MSSATKETYFVNDLVEHYEKLLKNVGIDLCDLPEDCKVILKEYAETKETTKLADLDLTNLKEFYHSKFEELIDRSIILDVLETDIEDLENNIRKESETIQELENFYENEVKNTITEAVVEKTRIITDPQIKLFTKNRQSCPENFDMLELIRKIELLEEKGN